MTIAQQIASAAAASVLVGFLVASGIAWGMQRADVRHLKASVTAIANDIVSVKEDSAKTREAIASIQGQLRGWPDGSRHQATAEVLSSGSSMENISREAGI